MDRRTGREKNTLLMGAGVSWGIGRSGGSDEAAAGEEHGATEQRCGLC
jgi:hypothetical protein